MCSALANAISMHALCYCMYMYSVTCTCTLMGKLVHTPELKFPPWDIWTNSYKPPTSAVTTLYLTKDQQTV